jgi:hypothetical protein
MMYVSANEKAVSLNLHRYIVGGFGGDRMNIPRRE